MSKKSNKASENEIIYQAEVIKGETYDSKEKLNDKIDKLKVEAKEAYYNTKENLNP